MARLLKGGRPFKPVAIVVVKDEPKAKATGKILRGKFIKPPVRKKAKPTPVPAPDAGRFRGKF
jgi:hypothetical protein